MTSTITRTGASTDEASSPPSPIPRQRRRPAAAVATLAAAVVGALGIAYVWTQTTNASAVLVVTHDVARGEVIEADDLGTARISTDPVLKPIAATRRDAIVGQRASTAIPSGTLLTDAMVASSVVPGDGQSLVPVDLPAEQAAGLGLVVGDRVKVVLTAADGHEPSGNPQFTAAEVAGVTTSPDGTKTVVALVVPEADGPVLADRVAAGNFYVIVDSRQAS